jgi:peroxiredoxin
MSRVRTVFLVVLAALILGGVYLLRGTRTLAGVPLDAPAPDVRLQAPYRGPVSLSGFAGEPVLLTFGRPSCDSCNPHLTALADAVARLGDRGDLRVLYVSLEPVSGQELLAFVQDHDLGFTGLYGDSAIVARAATAYREATASVPDSVVAAASLAPAPDAPRIYGIDRTGTLRAVWGPGDPAALARDIRLLLRYR